MHVKIKFSLRRFGSLSFDASDVVSCAHKVNGEVAALKHNARKLEVIFGILSMSPNVPMLLHVVYI